MGTSWRRGRQRESVQRRVPLPIRPTPREVGWLPLLVAQRLVEYDYALVSNPHLRPAQYGHDWAKGPQSLEQLQVPRASSTTAVTTVITISDAVAAPVKEPSAQSSRSRSISGQSIIGCSLIKGVSGYQCEEGCGLHSAILSPCRGTGRDQRDTRDCRAAQKGDRRRPHGADDFPRLVALNGYTWVAVNGLFRLPRKAAGGDRTRGQRPWKPPAWSPPNPPPWAPPPASPPTAPP